MPSFIQTSRIRLQPLKTDWLLSANVSAAMLRLDLLHPEVSGNKWFKLKYNLEKALGMRKNTILTFGGARSNHIAATAAACRLSGLKSVGMIRGEQADNPTLAHARAEGMQLYFMSREQYRNKKDPTFLKRLRERFPEAFILPEGGNNSWGIKGAGEILHTCETKTFTHICCPVGTGATLSGLIAQAESSQKILGFSALRKADEQRSTIKAYLKTLPNHTLWEIITEYHFGGFAKKTQTLLNFMEAFRIEHGVPLDFVYTAKMLFGIRDLAEKGRFPPGSRILLIHTGGLQGNEKSA